VIKHPETTAAPTLAEYLARWLDEAVRPNLRLGHSVPGMRGVYNHVSDTMRAELKHALQSRWETSLRDRAAIAPHSPIPLLDGLLAPNRETSAKMISQIPPNDRRRAPDDWGKNPSGSL
jgi:hypothetical protein